MTLIADSGSTKVDWRFIAEDGSVKNLLTSGINPVYLTDEQIVDVLRKEVIPAFGERVDKVFFYGAGVVGESHERLLACFKEVFPNSECEAKSDIEAAARALCGHSAGIAAILGTGSNSCFYDGKDVAKNVHPGGFIIGDEGSGADMGKMLVSDYVKGILPQSIENEFRRKYGLEYADIVSKVYREPMPSRFPGFLLSFHREV
jgi:N-acetylglucosamine kinase-like BadF-type ATPase